MYLVKILPRGAEITEGILLGSFSTIEPARHAQSMVQGTFIGMFPESFYTRDSYRVVVVEETSHFGEFGGSKTLAWPTTSKEA